RPHALAADPMRGWVYTASLAVNQIVAVDPVQEEIELTMMGGERPHTFIGFAISPDGNLMVASTELTSKLFVFDLDRAPDMTPVDTIDLEGSPWHPVFTPDGRWVYVGNNWNNSVTVVDMDTRSVHSVVTGNGIAQPHGSATSPDGRFVYVSSRNLEMPPGHSKADHVYRPRHDFGDNYNIGTVVVIDTASQAIVRIIEVEDYASGLGRAPTYIGNRQ
ncbi:MAG: YncE family protein, partial [Gemmatimonadales bacterium]